MMNKEVKMAKGKLIKSGSLKDLVSPKMLVVYVAFLAAVYFVGNSFAAAEAANNLLSAADLGLVNKIAGVRWVSRLSAENNSYETGTVTLIGVKDQTKVLISIGGEPAGATQPAHIHTGSCPNPGAVVYPLTNVVNGLSVTLLSVKLSDLQKMVPLAVNVHKSAADIKTYYACGDLK